MCWRIRRARGVGWHSRSLSSPETERKRWTIRAGVRENLVGSKIGFEEALAATGVAPSVAGLWPRRWHWLTSGSSVVVVAGARARWRRLLLPLLLVGRAAWQPRCEMS